LVSLRCRKRSVAEFMQESIVFLVRVQYRGKESLRSPSHLLMSFLSLYFVLANKFDLIWCWENATLWVVARRRYCWRRFCLSVLSVCHTRDPRLNALTISKRIFCLLEAKFRDRKFRGSPRNSVFKRRTRQKTQIWPIICNNLETWQTGGMLVLITNRKSHWGFRLVLWMIWNGVMTASRAISAVAEHPVLFWVCV